MATQRAVVIPEIVQCIVENTIHDDLTQCADTGTLFEYLTVNHVWYAEAVRVMWRKIELQYLWKLPFSRRQYFANMVVEIETNAEYDHLMKQTTRKGRRWLAKNRERVLEFPKLEKVELYVLSDHIPDEAIAQYFVPTLRKIFMNGNLSDGLLSTFVTRCRNIDEVKIDLLSRKISANGMKNFVRDCQARKLELMYCIDPLIPIAATKGGLEKLHLPDLDERNYTELCELKNAHQHTFKSLTSFSCRNNELLIEKILHIMPMLKDITLRVLDLNVALEHLTRQPLVESINIYSREGRLSPQILKGFVQKHRKLEQLNVAITGQHVAQDDLDNAWIEETTGFVPLLKQLGIAICNRITCDALIPIGLNCPFLQSITITSSRDGSVKSLEKGAFSRHQDLVFRNLYVFLPREWAHALPRWQIKRHFPFCYDTILESRNTLRSAKRELSRM